MSELRRTSDNWMAQEFHHYLLIKGLIHQFVVMQHSQKGFTQFQLLTENSFRYGIESYYKQRFLQLAGGGNFRYLSLIEGRFSPKYTALENHRLVGRIMRGFKQAQKQSALLSNTELKLVAHFIKKPDKSSSSPDQVRHHALRLELKKKALALVAFMRKSNYGKIVCGVDAAASELDAGPDVFSHAFRYLRKSGMKHFTYHVGEDFKHLLSGLRVIEEAVEFLEMKPGDRLGHCTAVGITPSLWVERTGPVCFLSQGEWLDNLIFVWSLMKESKDSRLQPFVLSVENEIAQYSYKIYREIYPAYLLETVWHLRKYNPFLYLKKASWNSIDDWNRVESLEERDKIRDQFSQKDIGTIMNMYHRSFGYQSGYDEMTCVHVSELIPVEVLEILQMLVLEKVSKKGIVIETLPTSNLHISYYKHLWEYHLGKWLDKDIGECLLPAVVVGTDDPGIFMTNIYNEYARVYLYMEEHGYSMVERMDKLRSIHSCSHIYKFSEYEK